MKVFIRKTLSGSEYWDTEAKQTLFIPVGEEPPFKVTTEYDSLILKKDSDGNVLDGVVTGVDFASGKDMTVIDGINLEDLNADQLLSFAEQSGIDVPGNMKKEETIRNYINDALNAVDDE